MHLTEIDRISSITKVEFVKNYLNPQKPVVIERLVEHWPAYSKWNFEYMATVAGEKMVPLYDDRPVQSKDGFNQCHATMKMRDYINLLKNEPTRYRIFLWNILKEVPELQKDFDYPDFGIQLMKKLPMLFFGGENSYTFMHYDIDLANIFHFHFQGKKQVIFFDQKQTPFLYKVPHSLITREDIDFSNPDFDTWPALKNAQGFIANLEHGNMVYIPEGYWHYMRYITPGFSMSLRAIAKNPKNLSKAIYNIFVMRHYDSIMRKIYGQDWIDSKNEKAILNTHKQLNIRV